MTIKWTDEDQAAAELEGWTIGTVSCVNNTQYDEIQAVLSDDVATDPQRFISDFEAVNYVFGRAMSGSELHRRAFFYVLRPGNMYRKVE